MTNQQTRGKNVCGWKLSSRGRKTGGSEGRSKGPWPFKVISTHSQSLAVGSMKTTEQRWIRTITWPWTESAHYQVNSPGTAETTSRPSAHVCVMRNSWPFTWRAPTRWLITFFIYSGSDVPVMTETTPWLYFHIALRLLSAVHLRRSGPDWLLDAFFH